MATRTGDMSDWQRSELADTVLGDLRALADLFEKELSNYSARTASLLLRKLVLDRNLFTYRRQLGLKQQPRVKTLDLVDWLSGDYKAVRLAGCGGVTIGPVDYGPFAIPLNRPLPPIVPMKFATMPLLNYLDAPGAVAMGRVVKRAQLIRYVAHKLGGAHFDASRKRKSKRKGTATDAVDVELQVAVDLDRAVDPSGWAMNAQPPNVTLLSMELLAIAQHLLRSPEVRDMLPADVLVKIPTEGFT